MIDFGVVSGRGVFGHPALRIALGYFGNREQSKETELDISSAGFYRCLSQMQFVRFHGAGLIF